MTTKRKEILVWSFFLLLLTYLWVSVYWTVAVRPTLPEVGWYADRRGDAVFVLFVDARGPAAGALQAGDLVTEINGEPVRELSSVVTAFDRVSPGQRYRIAVRREDDRRECELPVVSPRLDTLTLFANIIVPLVFLATGASVFLFKRNNRQATLLALMFGTFIGALPSLPPFLGVPAPMMWAVAATKIVAIFFWPVFLHFFLIFPEPSPLLRRFPRLEFGLYVPRLVISFPLLATYHVSLALGHERVVDLLLSKLDALGFVSTVLACAYVIAGLAVMLDTYRRAGAASRRRLRVVVAGSVGFVPLLPLIGLFLFAQTQTPVALGSYEWLPVALEWLGLSAYVAFPLFPLAFAYAIVRHQVIPVSLIVRRGVRYLLIRRGFVLIETAAAAAFLAFILTGRRAEFLDGLGRCADVLIGFCGVLLVVAALNAVKRSLMPSIDRRFFRETYDTRRILTNLGKAVRAMSNVNQLLELTATTLKNALQTENVHIFMRDDATGDFVCVVAMPELGAAGNPPLTLARDAFVVRRLRRIMIPLTVDPADFLARDQAASETLITDRSIGGGRARERDALMRIRSALLVQIVAKNSLLGVISLGPRLSELPFSGEDREMLAAVASQIAFAIENARLVHRAAEEERIRRELDMAAQTQRRLFPSEAPRSEAADLSGVCVPARGVGGDYYDFLKFDNRQLGVAVADVAGKGISAALVMSIVQASLRSQAELVRERPTDLAATMNRLLYSSTYPHDYATFFFAVFDEPTRRLTYVNAGHNPPLVIRAARPASGRAPIRPALTVGGGATATAVASVAPNDRITELTTGGPVIGLFDFGEYEQETVQLESGDLVVAYTDGVTEALSPAGEEFGEARLRETLLANFSSSAETIQRAVIDALHEWCQDAPQHDDLTLVILKVK